MRKVGNALKWFLIGLIASPVALAGDQPGPLGDKLKLKGVVVETASDRFLVRDDRNQSTTVRFLQGVEIEEKRSNFFRSPVAFGREDIVAGLKLVVVGRPDEGGVLWAEKIKFTQDNLKVAQIVDASLVPVENRFQDLEDTAGRLSGQVDELNEANRNLRGDLKQTSKTAEEAMQSAAGAHQRIDGAESRIHSMEHRFAELAEYRLGETVAVYFEAGRHSLSESEKEKLDRLVEAVGDGKGVLLEVTGFASADGSEAYNRRLSEQRARSVVRYLAEHHQLPLRLFVNPHGFGELQPAADNDTPEGRRLNRRAEVRILINQGLRSSAEVTG